MTAARHFPVPPDSRRRPRHSWHLVRCHECRKMMMNSAPKCPHCATWQPDARVFSITFSAMAGLVCAAAVVVVVGWYARELIALRLADGTGQSQAVPAKISGP